MTVKVKAYAKVNLTLDVVGKYPNGYHELRMIMQTIDLHDDVVLMPCDSGISFSCSDASLPTDGKNLAVKAAMAFYEYTHLSPAVDIRLEKHIPAAAGLAGGSADAAAVLRGLNVLHNTGLSDDELCSIGVNLGADVPFCIVGGTKMCEGIGELISSLPSLPNCYILLVKPDFPVSTPQVYKAIDEIEYEHPDNDGAVKALESGGIYTLAEKMANVLELVTGRDHPEIAELRREMDAAGAVKSMMSGSGPTVFGIFDDQEKALAAEKRLKNDSRRVVLAKPISHFEAPCIEG